MLTIEPEYVQDDGLFMIKITMENGYSLRVKVSGLQVVSHARCKGQLTAKDI
jgi:hypothetical protein